MIHLIHRSLYPGFHMSFRLVVSYSPVWAYFLLISPRQDKLIVLLDTGSSSLVRNTAAKQLADLTLKLFRAHGPHVQPQQEDSKSGLENGSILHGSTGEERWVEVLETVSKLLPLLKSRSSETRHASSNALGLLASFLPDSNKAFLDLSAEPIDLQSLAKSGQTLLASAGREYIAKPLPGDKAKRRQAMMGSLGLGDAVGWGDDMDKVIGDEEEVEVDPRPGEKPPEPIGPPKDVFEGLSARQITMLKRKKGNILEEANK